MSDSFDYESAVWGSDTINPAGRTIASYRLSEILFHLPERGRVAEIGCGAGRFLGAIAQLRPQLSLVGMDVSQAALRAAKARLPSLELRSVEGTTLPATDAEFDAVLLLDVLEHVAEPRALVAEVVRILKPAGLLHVHVPCEGDTRCLWRWLPRQRGRTRLKRALAGHEQQFRREDVLTLLRAAGFEIVRVRNSLHLVGNLADVAAFVVLAAQQRSSRSDASRRTTGDLLGSGSRPAAPLVRVVDAMLWWEARLLGRLPSWGLHVSARRQPTPPETGQRR